MSEIISNDAQENSNNPKKTDSFIDNIYRNNSNIAGNCFSALVWFLLISSLIVYNWTESWGIDLFFSNRYDISEGLIEEARKAAPAVLKKFLLEFIIKVFKRF